MTQGIREGAERARKIVRDLRVFARSQDDVWQPVDLHEEIESSLTLLNHLLKDRVTVHRKLGELPHVECIRSSIDQVFLNLLANAAQAIEGPGAITIETRREDDMAVISIADTGPGIAPDVIGRVFDPFFTTKTVGEGTGLGLSISYEIVKKHGGEILAESPAARRRGLHGAPPHRPQGSGVTAEATVLLVDDEVRVLDSLEALLAMDYRVLRAERPEAALDLLAAEPVALVISDQRMPGMTGTEFLARCREVSPEAVRVLLTAFTDADALMESINAANIYHFILKPWDPTELVHTVRRGVERHRLAAEREQLVRDLAAKNTDLEATLVDLRLTQDRVLREAAVRAQLQRYVSPRLAEMALGNPGLLDGPGDWREATVLFADIRGYTRLIETTPGPVVIRLLDGYLNEMIEVIFRHQGTVEQLIGDEIVVLFGVTEDAADAPGRAVRAAIDMVAAVRGLSKRWAADGLPRFDIGVGIASGPVMAGTIGSAERRELIVVGRPMIAAARIQRMTRLFEAHIIAAESTFRDVEALVRHRELGSPKLKGLKDRETLYEILGMREPASTAP